MVFCGLATRIRLLRVSAETKLGRNWLASLRGLIVAFRTKENILDVEDEIQHLKTLLSAK